MYRTKDKQKNAPRVIVITGGTKGVGKAIAAKFAKKGNTVIILSRTATGENAYSCDVSDADRVDEVFADIFAKYGKIDMLVNCAGVGISGAIELIPKESIRRLYDINLGGVINCSRAALKYMVKGAKIINISSVSAFIPMPFRTGYSSSKAAVNMFSLGLKQEVGPAGIMVSAVCLGDVQTDFLDHRIKDTTTNERYGVRLEIADEFALKRHKSGNKADPDKIAKLVCNFADRKYINTLHIVGIKYKLFYALFKVIPMAWAIKIVTLLFSRKQNN